MDLFRQDSYTYYITKKCFYNIKSLNGIDRAPWKWYNLPKRLNMRIEEIMEKGFTKSEAEYLLKILIAYQGDTATTCETAFMKVLNIRQLGLDYKKMLSLKLKGEQLCFSTKLLDHRMETINTRAEQLRELSCNGISLDWKKVLETNPKSLTCSEENMISSLESIKCLGLNPIRMVNKCPFLLSKSFDGLASRLKIFVSLFGTEEVEENPSVLIPSLKTSLNRLKLLFIEGRDIRIQDFTSKNSEFCSKYDVTDDQLENLTYDADLNAAMVTLLVASDLNLSDEESLFSLKSLVCDHLNQGMQIEGDDLLAMTTNAYIDILYTVAKPQEVAVET